MKKSKKGSVLLVALLVAAIGGLIVTTFIRSATLELEISSGQFYSDSALNIADAGAETGVLAVNQNDWTGWTLNGNDAIRALSPIDLGNGMLGDITVEVQDKDFTPTIISEVFVLNLDRDISDDSVSQIDRRKRSNRVVAVQRPSGPIILIHREYPGFGTRIGYIESTF